MADNLVVALVVGFVLLGWGFVLWYFRGRSYVSGSGGAKPSPHERGRLVGLFERLPTPTFAGPIQDLTPGEVGVLVDGRADDHDVVAEILALVEAGYLTLEPQRRIDNHHLNYLFTRLKSDYTNLPRHQALVMDMLFTSSTQVKLTQLLGKARPHFAQIKKALVGSIGTKKVYVWSKRQQLMSQALLWVSYFLMLLTTVGWYWLLSFLGYWICFKLWFRSRRRDKFTLDQSQDVAITFAILGLVQALFLLVAHFYIMLVDQVWLGLVSMLITPVFMWIGHKFNPTTAVGTYYMQQIKGMKIAIKAGLWREQKKEKDYRFTEGFAYATSMGLVGYIAADLKNLNRYSRALKDLYQIYGQFDTDMTQVGSRVG